MFDGRKLFIASTHETDLKRANAIAGPMVAAWQRRIDEARLLRADPGRLEVDRRTTEYKRLKARANLDEAANLLILDVTQFVFERLGGMTADQRRQALIASRGNVAAALERSLGTGASDQIIGRATPFSTHFETWKTATL